MAQMGNDEQGNNLKGQVGVLKATITIKRKATGKEEVYEVYELTSEPINKELAEKVLGHEIKE